MSVCHIALMGQQVIVCSTGLEDFLRLLRERIPGTEFLADTVGVMGCGDALDVPLSGGLLQIRKVDIPD